MNVIAHWTSLAISRVLLSYFRGKLTFLSFPNKLPTIYIFSFADLDVAYIWQRFDKCNVKKLGRRPTLLTLRYNTSFVNTQQNSIYTLYLADHGADACAVTSKKRGRELVTLYYNFIHVFIEDYVFL